MKAPERGALPLGLARGRVPAQGADAQHSQ